MCLVPALKALQQVIEMAFPFSEAMLTSSKQVMFIYMIKYLTLQDILYYLIRNLLSCSYPNLFENPFCRWKFHWQSGIVPVPIDLWDNLASSSASSHLSSFKILVECQPALGTYWYLICLFHLVQFESLFVQLKEMGTETWNNLSLSQPLGQSSGVMLKWESVGRR